MRCPGCGHLEDKVLDSRAAREGAAVRRRRECLNCGRRFRTYEQVDETALMVVKKDGRREPFDRGKILRGMLTACEKRPVPVEVLEEQADEIEREMYARGAAEVPSRELGERVSAILRTIDSVAYVRFASVYLEFQNIAEFTEIVNKLASQGSHPGEQPAW